MAFNTAISQYKEYDDIREEEYWIPYMRKHTSERDDHIGN